MDFMGLDDEITGGSLLEEGLQGLGLTGDPVVQSPIPQSAGFHRVASIWIRFPAKGSSLGIIPAALQMAACMSGVSAFQLDQSFPGHIIATCTPHDVYDSSPTCHSRLAKLYHPIQCHMVVHPRLHPEGLRSALLRLCKPVCAARSRSFCDAITREQQYNGHSNSRKREHKQGQHGVWHRSHSQCKPPYRPYRRRL